MIEFLTIILAEHQMFLTFNIMYKRTSIIGFDVLTFNKIYKRTSWMGFDVPTFNSISQNK